MRTHTCAYTDMHIHARAHTRVHTGMNMQMHMSVCPEPCQLFASVSRFLPQWSYGFYLIHLQGKQGFQFFCKTEDMKRKWMEQFEMAM